MKFPPVLVVGHGYLGRELAGELYRRGHPVGALHRGEPDRAGAYPVFSGNVGAPEDLAELGRNFAPERIVHCASSGRGGVESYRLVFVEGLKALRSAFPGVPIFFTSSTSVYHQADGSTVDETSPTAPERETGRLLLEAESLARESGGVVLRLAGIYGPGRSVHLHRVLSGQAAIEDTEPSRFLNQIHRDDAVAAIVHLLEIAEPALSGRVFNVADDTPLTQRDCYESLARHLGFFRPPLVPPDLARKRGWTHKIVSNAALRATGWKPRFPSFLEALDGDPRLIPSIREAVSGPEREG